MTRSDVYETLKQKIINGELAPGEWVVEREISQQYELSRTPVRELLRQLVVDGLLELKPNKGYMVRKLSLKEIVDGFHTREAVEGMQIRLACQRGDDEFFSRVAEIRKKFESMRTDEDVKAGVSIGRELHDLIAETADNTLLLEFYNKLQNIAALTWNITKNSIPFEQKARDEHLTIIKVLEDKDAEKCEQYMREHLKSTCRILVETYLLEQSGGVMI